MSDSALIPTQETVLRTMQLLYGESVAVTETSDADQCIFAVYVSDDDVPLAAAWCDISFGAYAGASLTRIPKGGADDAAMSGELPTPIYDNLREVMNILASLFMNDKTPHLRLGTVYPDMSDVPDEEKAMFEGKSGSSFTVEVPNYGKGNVQMVIT